MPKLLKLCEVAETLGLSVRKIRKDVEDGRFAPTLVRFGRSVRVRQDELAEWIAAGCPDRSAWRAAREEVAHAS